MNILQLNADVYNEVISQLEKAGKQSHADLLNQIKIQAGINQPASSSQVRIDGELSTSQKEALRILNAGGSIRSLRWNELIFCCTYHEGKFKNIDTAEVEGLLSRGIIEGIPQNIFPDKEYVLTEFGKIVTV